MTADKNITGYIFFTVYRLKITVSLHYLFLFCLFGDVAFSEYFLYHFRFLFVSRIRRTRYVLSFRMVLFLPFEHGLDFLHQLM